MRFPMGHNCAIVSGEAKNGDTRLECNGIIGPVCVDRR